MKIKLIIIFFICTAAYSAAERRIAWEPVAGAWGYHLEIRDNQSNIIVDVAITDNSYAVSALEPGTYSFRISTLNILKQSGNSTAWINFIVEKMFIPRLKSVSQRQLLNKRVNKNILLKGRDIKPGARLFLRGNGRDVEITDLVIESDAEVLFNYKPDESMTGIFDLVIVNKGDAEGVLKNGIEIVAPEKANNTYYMGTGYTINIPIGIWSEYYKLSYTGVNVFFQISGRNLGFENLMIETELEAVRYNNIDSLKESTLSYGSLSIGSGYYYPLPGANVELLIKLHGGVVYTYLTLDENPEDRSAESIDTFVMAGAGVRLWLSEYLFVDSISLWRTVFYAKESFHNARFSIAFGLKF